jgi:uncharacterized protein
MTQPAVRSLHRYPVKSLLGETLPALDVDRRGVSGDRLWSVRTTGGRIGSGKTTRRFDAVPGLLELRAAAEGGRVVVAFPDGTRCAVDDRLADARLSEHLGRPLRFEQETEVTHFDDGPVSIIGSAPVDAVADQQGAVVDASRFRANVVLDTVHPFLEDGWVGRCIEIGTVALEVVMTSSRCVMVDMATADLAAQPGNLLATGRLNGACLGVIARVVRPGAVQVGDAVTIAEANRYLP